MQKLHEQLANMMDNNTIPRFMNRADAVSSVTQLAQETATFLREKWAGNAKALANLDQLMQQLAPQTMAAKYAPAPASFVQRAGQTAPIAMGAAG